MPRSMAASSPIRPPKPCKDAEAVVTMLPAGKHVAEVYRDRVFGAAPKSAILMDCSTIDVATAKTVEGEAAAAGFTMVDAPVSGGIAAADAGTLTFMVGGSDEGFERAKPFLEKMGKAVIHAGGPGAGQAAKICNNMLLGRDHGRDLRGVRARGEARPRPADLLRHLVQGVGPKLVDDQLLPGPRRRPRNPCRPRL